MNNENFELENMRQQMETLKKKLGQQEIVNDRIIRQSMKNTANKIMRRYYMIMAIAGATYYNSLAVSNSNMMSKNMIEVGRKMARAKKFDANWLFFGIPAVICWLAWLTWEFYQKDAEAVRYMVYGIACGAVIGAIVGFKMHFKTQRQYQEIIEQIEDITADE